MKPGQALRAMIGRPSAAERSWAAAGLDAFRAGLQTTPEEREAYYAEQAELGRGGNDPRRDPCRVLSTRQCPTRGCVELDCARFDDDDERRWGPEVQYIDDLGRAA